MIVIVPKPLSGKGQRKWKIPAQWHKLMYVWNEFNKLFCCSARCNSLYCTIKSQLFLSTSDNPKLPPVDLGPWPAWTANPIRLSEPQISKRRTSSFRLTSQYLMIPWDIPLYEMPSKRRILSCQPCRRLKTRCEVLPGSRQCARCISLRSVAQ